MHSSELKKLLLKEKIASLQSLEEIMKKARSPKTETGIQASKDTKQKKRIEISNKVKFQNLENLNKNMVYLRMPDRVFLEKLGKIPSIKTFEWKSTLTLKSRYPGKLLRSVPLNVSHLFRDKIRQMVQGQHKSAFPLSKISWKRSAFEFNSNSSFDSKTNLKKIKKTTKKNSKNIQGNESNSLCLDRTPSSKSLSTIPSQSVDLFNCERKPGCHKKGGPPVHIPRFFAFSKTWVNQNSKGRQH